MPMSSRLVEGIRRERFAKLVEDAGGPAKMAEKLGKSSSYVSQLTTGHRNIGRNAAKAIEDALGLPPDYLDARRPEAASVGEAEAGYSVQKSKDTMGGPAFPVTKMFVRDSGDDVQAGQTCGVTVWDYYAAAALAGVSTNPDAEFDIVKWSAEQADRMLAERAKRQAEGNSDGTIPRQDDLA